MSLNPKKKKCDECGELSVIWKSSGTGGRKLCKQCSNTGVAKLSSIKPTAKAKPIPPRSQKRTKEEKIYMAKRYIYLTEHPMCEAHISGICLKHASEIHHKAGKIGDDLIDETNFLAVCRECHNYIENNRSWAMTMGYSLKRIK